MNTRSPLMDLWAVAWHVSDFLFMFTRIAA